VSRATLTGLLGVAVLVGLLEILVAQSVISRFLIAQPSHVGREIVSLLLEERLTEAFLTTFAAMLTSTLLAILVGVPAGYALYRSKILGEAYGGWIAGMFSAPLILLYPLFLVLFGRGVQTIIAITVIIATIPIILNTQQAFTQVRRVFLDVARAFKLTQWQIFWKILLPAALPTIFTGIRLGLIYAMISVVAIEYLVVLGGLGSLVSDMYDRYNIAGMYAAIVAVLLVTVVFFKLASEVERWLRSM
jgi:ABC-type nitrate/sulfonate/bicarbonate transport system permease component